MVCLQVLNFERLLHVPLTESLQVPLQFPLLVSLYVFVFDAFSFLYVFGVYFLAL